MKCLNPVLKCIVAGSFSTACLLATDQITTEMVYGAGNAATPIRGFEGEDYRGNLHFEALPYILAALAGLVAAVVFVDYANAVRKRWSGHRLGHTATSAEITFNRHIQSVLSQAPLAKNNSSLTHLMCGELVNCYHQVNLQHQAKHAALVGKEHMAVGSASSPPAIRL